MTCPKCNGSMSPNPNKTPGSNPKLPDWLCDQANGPCGSDVTKSDRNGAMKTYHNVTGAWNPRPKVAAGYPLPQTASAPHEQMELTPDAAANAADKEMWRKKGEQMNRSNLAAAAIKSGRKLDAALKVEMDEWKYWTLTDKWMEI